MVSSASSTSMRGPHSISHWCPWKMSGIWSVSWEKITSSTKWWWAYTTGHLTPSTIGVRPRPRSGWRAKPISFVGIFIRHIRPHTCLSTCADFYIYPCRNFCRRRGSPFTRIYKRCFFWSRGDPRRFWQKYSRHHQGIHLQGSENRLE